MASITPAHRSCSATYIPAYVVEQVKQASIGRKTTELNIVRIRSSMVQRTLFCKDKTSSSGTRTPAAKKTTKFQTKTPSKTTAETAALAIDVRPASVFICFFRFASQVEGGGPYITVRITAHNCSGIPRSTRNVPLPAENRHASSRHTQTHWNTQRIQACLRQHFGGIDVNLRKNIQQK